MSNQTLGAVSRSKEFGFWGGKQQIPTVGIVPSFQHVKRIQETGSSTLTPEQKVASDVIPYKCGHKANKAERVLRKVLPTFSSGNQVRQDKKRCSNRIHHAIISKGNVKEN